MKKTLFCIILFLSPHVFAWGPSAQSYITMQAVNASFGINAYYECVEDIDLAAQKKYCQLFPKDYKENCLLYKEVVHPSTLALRMFDDPQKRVNYEACPINMPQERKYLCGDENVAGQLGRLWLEKAEGAKTKCQRIYLFTVAASFLADQFDPLNQVKYETPECNEDFHKKIEEKISSRESNWAVTIPCKFKYPIPAVGQTRKGSYSQLIRVTPKTFKDIVGNLTSHANRIKEKPYTKLTTTSTSTTTSTLFIPPTIPTTTQPTSTTTTLKKEVMIPSSIKKMFVAIIILIITVTGVFLWREGYLKPLFKTHLQKPAKKPKPKPKPRLERLPREGKQRLEGKKESSLNQDKKDTKKSRGKTDKKAKEKTLDEILKLEGREEDEDPFI